MGNEDAGRQGFMNMFIRTLQKAPTSPYDDSDVTPREYDVRATINKNTNDNKTDDDMTNRMSYNNRQVMADQDLYDADNPQDPSPLEQLLPKMVAGTATKAERMQFYNITGTPL